MDFGTIFAIILGITIIVVATVINREINRTTKNKPVEPIKPTVSSKPEPPTNPNLINCPDCYKEVSKNADVCIHCGCNLRLGHNKTVQAINKTSRGMMKFGCAGMLLQMIVVWLIVIGFIAYVLYTA